MAGNTGKMTKEAIVKRGPRKVLIRVYDEGKPVFMIAIEGQEPKCGRILARSYSESYLLRIAKSQANQ